MIYELQRVWVSDISLQLHRATYNGRDEDSAALLQQADGFLRRLPPLFNFSSEIEVLKNTADIGGEAVIEFMSRLTWDSFHICIPSLPIVGHL